MHIEYTIVIYNMYDWQIEEIPYDAINMGLGTMYKTEVYYCRGVKKGIRLNKLVMLEVSKPLRQSRVSDVAVHYIR